MRKIKTKTENPLLDFTVDELKLFIALEVWFDSIGDEYKINKNFWTRNKIGNLMKLRLKAMNKWKDGLRSPRKERKCDFRKQEKEIKPPEKSSPLKSKPEQSSPLDSDFPDLDF